MNIGLLKYDFKMFCRYFTLDIDDIVVVTVDVYFFLYFFLYFLFFYISMIFIRYTYSGNVLSNNEH